MKIAIHSNKEIFDHSTLWTNEWIDYCEENSLKYEIVNCFSNNIIDKLRKFDILLWHFSHYSRQEMKFARSILYSAKSLGLCVFPNFNTAWHFDDKVSQNYLLETFKAKIPKYWVFYTYKDTKMFLDNFDDFPVIFKLKSGSGSSNVRLIKNKRKALKFAKKIFNKGFNPRPSFIFKSKSALKSSKSIKSIINKLKRVPDFLTSYINAKNLDKEQGYIYFQDYIPNKGEDLKVAIIGNKLSFLRRTVRKGDFRASGSGNIFYDKEDISKEMVESLFSLHEKLGFQTMGYDLVVNKENNNFYIVEVSYGFSFEAQYKLGGYYKKDYTWVNKPLNVPREVLRNLVYDFQEKEGCVK